MAITTDATGYATGADYDAHAVQRRPVPGEGPNGNAVFEPHAEDEQKKMRRTKVGAPLSWWWASKQLASDDDCDIG